MTVETRAVARSSRDPALAATALIAALWAGFMVFMTWRHNRGYGTFAFDMGIYEQATWLMAYGKTPFMTVRGLNIWGHHVNPVLYFFAPAYRLGLGGPVLLSAVQAVVLASGAIPLFLLARARTTSRTALVVSVAYLLYPALGWMARNDFHPEVLSVGPTLWVGYLAYRRRWGWFAVATAVVLSTREEAGIVIGALGLTMAWRDAGWHLPRWRVPWRWVRSTERKVSTRPGLIVAAVGFGWFLFCTQVIIPRYVGGQPYYINQFFSEWGTGTGGIVIGILSRPDKVITVASRPARLEYFLGMFAPVALFPLVGLAMFAAAPQMGINTLTDVTYAHNIHYQYNGFVVAPLFLGLVDGVSRLRNLSRIRKWVPRVLLASTLICSLSMSSMPWSPASEGWWAFPDSRSRVMDRALQFVPAEGIVSATHRFVPKLTHRVGIYDFPNPFVAHDWGVTGSDPAPVDVKPEWLVFELDLLDEATQSYAWTFYGYDEAPYEVVFDEDSIVVARLRRPSQ